MRENPINKMVVDAVYGAGCFENPERLIGNAANPDPSKWVRVPIKQKFDTKLLKGMSNEDLSDMLTDLAEKLAGYRVSNAKAAISLKARAAQSKTDRHNLHMGIVALLNNDATREVGLTMLKQSTTEANVIAYCVTNAVPVPACITR